MKTKISRLVLLLFAAVGASARGDYPQEVANDQPAAWWRFQEPAAADGAAAKDQTGKHPATYRGGMTLEQGPAGVGSRAARFNGTTAYCEIPNSVDLPKATLSVEFWLQSSQAWNAPFWPGSATLISKATAGNGSGDWAIVGGSSRDGTRRGCVVVGVGPKPGTDAVLESPAAFNDGQWHHVVWTRSADGRTQLYVDGGLAAVANDGGGKIGNDRPIQIGGDPWLEGKSFDGRMAEVAVYAKALDAARIAAHAQAGGVKPRKHAVVAGQAKPYDPVGPEPRRLALQPPAFEHYVDTFNKHDRETVVWTIANASAWAWMRHNVPLFECPDKDIERTYYFRWWTYRKHIRQTPDGFVITEFLPNVPWAGKHNTISCAAGHHLMEGRWIRDPRYLDDYSVFWFRKGGEPRRYSFWAADAVFARYLVTGNRELTTALLPDLVGNYEAWEKTHRDPNGLFWQIDDRDGMEVSIGGSGYRATINSYQYGDATAIARIAEMAGQKDLAQRYREKATRIKQLVQERLWDPKAEFFKVAPRGESIRLADVREQHGLTPWYFQLPDPQYAVAWKQLMDPQGFFAPFGPTTAERRHPRFMFQHGHDCLWNGPSWPYATSVTLTALANLLNGAPQPHIGKRDYLETLRIYARSHSLKLAGGTVVGWIDEDLHPDTGEWIARSILEKRGTQDRGKDYNHSTFCDLVISGLVGLRPAAAGADHQATLDVNPLVPDGAWDYFCLDGVRYRGRDITILYDKTGQRYGKGTGLRVFADGQEVAAAEKLQRLTVPLPAKAREDSPWAETAGGWFKSPDNPVLGGDLGTCFDICVLKDNDKYRMWLSWRPKKSVALAESKDGVHWSQPVAVLGPNDQTDWEADINRAAVVRRDGEYRMWYTGQARGRSWIGCATSPDGRVWKRLSAKPVLTAEQPWEKVAVMCPHVIWDESAKLYRCWYSGGDQYEPNAIGYATSPDGLVWTKHPANPVFTPDAQAGWEKHKVTACQVVQHGGWHLMFYIGFRDEHHAQTGLARSKDGITGWQRHPANPLVRPGLDRWDHDACYKPFAILDGNRWLLWYNGRHGGFEQIGLATHEGEDLGF